MPHFSLIRRFVLPCWLLCACLASAQGQEFSIYTKLYHDAEGKPAKQPFCRCHTFFHANKGYDYIDSVGDVTILDYTAKKVTVLHGSRKIATSFTLAELDQSITEAFHQAEEFLKEPVKQVKYDHAQLHEFIKFQLHPEFEEEYDASTRKLTLSSEQLTYQAICASPETPQHLAAYLKFADSTTKVNYVLKSHAFLPSVRMKLNSTLRERGLIPVKVSLQTHCGAKVKLRAEHQYKWALEKADRQRIHEWESLLASKETKTVSLPEFQAAIEEDAHKGEK